MVIDERIVGQELGLKTEAINKLMVDLVSADTLEPVFFWMCPTNNGTIREERSLAEFPDRIDCDRCGRQHYFSTPDVEVHFLPSVRLRESLA